MTTPDTPEPPMKCATCGRLSLGGKHKGMHPFKPVEEPEADAVAPPLLLVPLREVREVATEVGDAIDLGIEKLQAEVRALREALRQSAAELHEHRCPEAFTLRFEACTNDWCVTARVLAPEPVEG